MRRSNRGFTLVEILVVVVIVGIVTSIALLSIGLAGDDRQVREEARRLASLIDVAVDESMMQGRDYGLELMTGSYRFVEFDPLTGQWAEILGDDMLRLRPLPEGMELDLFVEDQRVLLDPNPAEITTDEDDDDLSVEDYTPHLLIFSSGDVTPFELRLERYSDQRSVVIRGDQIGNIEFIDEEEMSQ